MTSSAEDSGELLLAALRRHPRRVMTSTELGAKVRQLPPSEVVDTIAALRRRHAVVTHDTIAPDPHLPRISAVALVDGPPDDAEAIADAGRRARECAQVLQRQLLRAHRCQ